MIPGKHVMATRFKVEIRDGMHLTVLEVVTDLALNAASPIYEPDKVDKLVTACVEHFQETGAAYDRIDLVEGRNA